MSSTYSEKLEGREWTLETDKVWGANAAPELAYVRDVSQPPDHSDPRYLPFKASHLGLHRFVPSAAQIGSLRTPSRGPLCLIDGKKNKCHKANILPAFMYQ